MLPLGTPERGIAGRSFRSASIVRQEDDDGILFQTVRFQGIQNAAYSPVHRIYHGAINPSFPVLHVPEFGDILRFGFIGPMGGIVGNEHEKRFLILSGFPQKFDRPVCNIVRQIGDVRLIRKIGYNHGGIQAFSFFLHGKIMPGTAQEPPPMRKTALRRRVSLRMAKMPLAEYRAPVPAGGQILRNQFFRLRQPVVGLRKIIHLDIGIRRDAVTLGETPRQQSHAGGGTHRCRHIRPGAKHALLGQPVNGRRFNLPGTSTAQIPITQVIRQNDNHVRRCGKTGLRHCRSAKQTA